MFDQLIAQLECENRELELIKPIHIDPSARHALRMRISRDDDLSASVDLEAARGT